VRCLNCSFTYEGRAVDARAAFKRHASRCRSPDERILALDREGLVRREIAELLGCSPALVSKVLQANGIRRRPGYRHRAA